MKIITTIEVTKQEKNILYNALQAYKDYLDKLLLEEDYNKSEFAKKIVDEIISETNKLFKELEKEM